MSTTELVDVCEEYSRRLRALEFDREVLRNERQRLQTRVAVMESFIREKGGKVDDALQAWADKGYGL
jgi:hypothetical protein